MTDLLKIHEREVFDLVGRNYLSLSDIQPSLERMGFQFVDDFASLKRTDKIEVWQTETLLHCNFLASGKAVYPDENSFASLRVAVLVASLPEQQVVRAASLIFDIAEKFHLGVSNNSKAVVRDHASQLIAGWMAEILNETGDVCGSESAAILIQFEHDKHRK